MTIGFGEKKDESPNQRYLETYVEIISSSKPRITGFWKEEQGDVGYLSPFIDSRLDENCKEEYFLNYDPRGHRFIIMHSDIKPSSIEKILKQISIINNQNKIQQDPKIQKEKKIKACLRKFLHL